MPSFNRPPTPPTPPTPTAPVLTGLGQALRWLRERQVRKQYRVASDAGITKGMLSAYETGRQRPSLETLDKLLETLGSDLNDLHNALQIVNGRPEMMKGWRDASGSWDQVLPAYLRQAPHLAGHPRSPAQLDEVHERTGFAAPGSPGVAGRTEYSDLPGLAGSAEPFRPAGAAGAAGSSGTAGPAGPDVHGAHGAYGAQGVHGAHGAAGADSADGARSGAHAGGASGSLPGGTATSAGRTRDHLYRVLTGAAAEGPFAELSLPPLAPLPREEEEALGQMLEGFHNLLRYWHGCLATLVALAAATGVPPAPAARAAPADVSPAAAESAPGGAGAAASAREKAARDSAGVKPGRRGD